MINPQVSRRSVLQHSLLAGVGIGALSAALANPTIASAAEPTLPTIPNPSFEDSTTTPGLPDGWGYGSSGSQGTGVLDDTVSRTGRRSFRTTTGAGDRYTVQQYLKPTAGGYHHRFSVWYRVQSTTTAPSIQLYFYDSARKLLAQTSTIGSVNATDWTQLTVELAAPATTAFYVLSLANWYTGGTVWWDDVSVVVWVAAAPYGGDYLEHGTRQDLLSLGLAAGTAGYRLRAIEAFGTTLTATDSRTFTATTGQAYRWRGTGVTWDAGSGTLRIAPGTTCRLDVTGSFSPPRGQSFPTVTLRQVDDPVGSRIHVIASGFSSPDHGAERTIAAETLAAARRGSDYLETRVLDNGGIGIAHPTWAGDIQPDPQGNASSANTNTRLWHLTGEERYRERAIRILDFLLTAQAPSGGFGFPWAYGIAQAHFDYPGHYPIDGKSHAKGEVMAIISHNAAGALLEGYRAFGQRRHLDAVTKEINYILHDKNGLQFLDADEEYASIPYCSMDPIDANGGHATEVYNVDGAFLALLPDYLAQVQDRSIVRYGDAIARNLARRIEADGSVAYAWYTTGKPTDYASIVYGGLLKWGAYRSQKQWIQVGRRGMSWMTNVDRPSQMLWESYTTVLGGLDNTTDVINYCRSTVGAQRPDGSWTGGTSTRSDSGNASLLAALLVQMEYRP